MTRCPRIWPSRVLAFEFIGQYEQIIRIGKVCVMSAVLWTSRRSVGKRRRDWPRIMSLIATGRFPVERAVSHEIPLGAAVQDGFDELCSPASTAVKVLIKI